MPDNRSRVALFVDFDNIYLGFKQESSRAAEEFATNPARWLRWIEAEMPRTGDTDGTDLRRSVLVRRCYLNPDSFAKYRAYFTRSGFSVVDCPPLTTRGKTSADIVMVMDMLDALEHDTRFDEFVIMSGDADFTPVLQRLRAHDRRTAALVGGFVAPAYRAACDLLISEDTFIERALGLRESPQAAIQLPKLAPAPSDLLDGIAQRVYEKASAAGAIPAAELPGIFREFREFTSNSNWLGFFSLRALSEQLVARRPELQLTDEDPWRVVVVGAEPGEAGGAQGNGERDELRRRITDRVAALVASSAEPVVMARAAQEAIDGFGRMVTDSRWLGHGTFKALLAAAEFPFPLQAGYLYDPARHSPPRENGNDVLQGVRDDLAAFIRRVHQLTDTPRLTPPQYRLVFELLARELNRRPYNLTDTSRELRDQLVERGESIPRQSTAFVVRGLQYAGYRYARNVDAGDAHTPDELAMHFHRNVVTLLSQAQATPSDEERLLLDEWILGRQPAAPEEPAPERESGADAPEPLAETSVVHDPAPGPVPTEPAGSQPGEPGWP
jgi:hypothetical protein